jgi:chromosome partitioning protein
VAFGKSYLMRIRRRDKDPAETAGSGEPGIAPYDYDEERPEAPDPVAGLIAEPALAGTGQADAQAATGVDAESVSSPPSEAAAPSYPSSSTVPAEADTVYSDEPPSPPEPAEVTPADATQAQPAAPASTAPTPPVEDVQELPAQPEAAQPEAAQPEAAQPEAAQPEVTEPEAAPPAAAEPAAARAPSSAPKHAMRAPSIGTDASDLLNGFKPVQRDLPRIIAIANQKGGVGKTTTTVNLGAALAELDYRVLVIDLDPQGNATTGLGVEARNFEHSMYDVIMRDLPLEDAIEPTSVKNLFVAPATIDLAGVEIELVPAFSRELKLKRAIDTVVDDFDFVIIDCPPSLGLITVNGLAAADEVLVPIQCEYYALEGLSQLLRNVNLVSTNLNQTLEVSTIVLTMYDARTRLSVDVANEVRQHFSERVCRAVIPRTVRLSEAPSFGQPITVFDPTSRGAVAYRELAKEVSNGAPQRSR